MKEINLSKMDYKELTKLFLRLTLEISRRKTLVKECI